MENKELNFISERIREKKEQLSREKLEIPEEKKLITETIDEQIEDSLIEQHPDMDFLQSESQEKISFPKRIYTENKRSLEQELEEANIKLSELVSIALEKNIPFAIKTALKTGNAFLIDKLRDSLANRYSQELKDKNLI